MQFSKEVLFIISKQGKITLDDEIHQNSMIITECVSVDAV